VFLKVKIEINLKMV